MKVGLQGLSFFWCNLSVFGGVSEGSYIVLFVERTVEGRSDERKGNEGFMGLSVGFLCVERG